MSQPNPESGNPYQSPVSAGPLVAASGESTLAIVKLLRDFRSQIVALGAFWIIIGLLAAGAGSFAAAAGEARDQGRADWVAIGVAVVGVLWIALGALVCAKQMWALYVALVLSYLSLVGNLLRLNLCGIIVLIVVIMQAHRVLGWAKQLTAAGIPLSTRPEEIHVPISLPQ